MKYARKGRSRKRRKMGRRTRAGKLRRKKARQSEDLPGWEERMVSGRRQGLNRVFL